MANTESGTGFLMKDIRIFTEGVASSSLIHSSIMLKHCKSRLDQYQVPLKELKLVFTVFNRLQSLRSNEKLLA